MALPTDFNLVQLYDKAVNIRGEPASGTITLEPTHRLDSVGTGTAILPAAIVITLDGSGTFGEMVPRCDDPDITPSGWVYKVTENYNNVKNRPAYLVSIEGSQPVRLSSLAAVVAPTALMTPVRTVNGVEPDPTGNIEVAGGPGGGVTEQYVDDTVDDAVGALAASTSTALAGKADTTALSSKADASAHNAHVAAADAHNLNARLAAKADASALAGKMDTAAYAAPHAVPKSSGSLSGLQSILDAHGEATIRGGTYTLPAALVMDAESNAGFLNVSPDARITYTGTGVPLTIKGGTGGTQPCGVIGGVWVGTSAAAGCFRVLDCNGAQVQPYKVEGFTNGFAVELRNETYWTERVRIIGLREVGSRHAILFTPQSVSGGVGGTESFKGVLITDLNVQGGTSGHPKVWWRGAPYHATVQRVKGNIASGVEVYRFSGTPGGLWSRKSTIADTGIECLTGGAILFKDGGGAKDGMPVLIGTNEIWGAGNFENPDGLNFSPVPIENGLEIKARTTHPIPADEGKAKVYYFGKKLWLKDEDGIQTDLSASGGGSVNTVNNVAPSSGNVAITAQQIPISGAFMPGNPAEAQAGFNSLTAWVATRASIVQHDGDTYPAEPANTVDGTRVIAGPASDPPPAWANGDLVLLDPKLYQTLTAVTVSNTTAVTVAATIPIPAGLEPGAVVHIYAPVTISNNSGASVNVELFVDVDTEPVMDSAALAFPDSASSSRGQLELWLTVIDSTTVHVSLSAPIGLGSPVGTVQQLQANRSLAGFEIAELDSTAAAFDVVLAWKMSAAHATASCTLHSVTAWRQ